VKKRENIELLPTIVLMVGAFLIPLFLIVLYAFKSEGGLNFFSPLNLHVVKFTFYQAMLSALLATALGLPAAYLIGKTSFKFKGIFSAFSSVPFVMPSVSMALGFFTFYGSNGLLNEYFLWPLFHVKFEPLFSLLGIVMGNAFYNFPLVMLIVGGALAGVNPVYLEAAKIDGASTFKGFFHVELPIIFPSLVSAFLLAFIYCFTSFAVVLMLGGARYATMEVQIYMYLKTLLDFKDAAALTILQLTFVFLLSFALSALKKGFGAFSQELSTSKAKFPLWGYFYMLFIGIFAFGPIFSQVFGGFWDFQRSHFTFEWMQSLFSGRMDPYIGNSIFLAILWTLVFALTSAFFVVILSSVSGHAVQKKKTRFWDAFLTSPLSVSPVTLAFGYVVLQGYIYIAFPIEMIVIYTVISFPIGFQIFSSAWERFPTSIEDAASIEGANFRVKLFRIYLPILKPQMLSSFLFSFAIAIGEMGATMVLYDPRFPTISVSAYRLFSSRHMPQAQALGTLLTLATFAIFYTMEKPFLAKK
jgi:thiamine transport system permease protein